ncbi:hypothetical protein [Georgenia yuyongxinii]|uniref:Uncharacterized protein n=1 Tax=Georgenia yuyongxinii TaxID=2589797 RepID=A0A552WX50_9MICO|nr:hypothetical protein [Georgenia yuyongxinii]TRW47411.1 hypothetical protein FJ693_01005 [Georgenia yuyongxinii]
MSTFMKQCLVGFHADPIACPMRTAQYGTRAQKRLPDWRRDSNGEYTALKSTYCTPVALDEVALELCARFIKPDKITAAGVRVYFADCDGIAEPRERFVANHVEHAAVRYRHVVERPRMRAESLDLRTSATGR